MKKTYTPSLRKGSTLADGKAHAQEHQLYSRRNFLSRMGWLGGAGMIAGNLTINSLTASPLIQALSTTESENILVLIQLKGGNDGLNTIVPLYDYGYYQQVRPTLAIPEQNVLPLSESVGIPNYMEPIQRMWNDGRMKVLNSVGYPEQNLSHFRSMDIWDTASDEDEVISTGWLGRWLDQIYPDFISSPPAIPPAVQIGGIGRKLFTGSALDMAISVANPDELYEIAQTGRLFDPEDVPANCYGDELTFLRTVANSTFIYSEAIKQAFDASANSVQYTTNSDLGNQMALVARLIKGNLGTRLYMVSIDGFDTHDNQADLHQNLLTDIAISVRALFEDLGTAGMEEKVMAMTFSEFGRRIEQNASNGTDHGTSAPLMVFGGCIEENGFIGAFPDLQNPDIYGNLQFETDFRAIYATVLEGWLGVEGAVIDNLMGRRFDRIDALGLNCSTSTPIDPNLSGVFSHQALYNRPAGELVIRYHLPSTSPVKIDLIDMKGQVVRPIWNDRMPIGNHEVKIPYRSWRIPAGVYVYRIEAMGRLESRTVSLI